jgi:prepilin-type N-terminal cleavage/methylation domain-containing protein
MRRNKNRLGFTLVEIMIVVLIIGILLSIAVPNFIKARENTRTRTCVAQLQRIEAAKEQWAMEMKKVSGDAPVAGDLVPDYIKGSQQCPNGFGYSLGTVGTKATCLSGIASHTLP